jgi:hypothetical protein
MVGGLITLMAGIVCLAFGGFLTWAGSSNAAYANQLSQYVAWSPNQPVDMAIASPSYLEGIVSDRNPTYTQGLVAYTRSDYRGTERRTTSDPNGHSYRRPVWKEDERMTPALWLDVEGQAVQIPADYSIGNISTTWISTTTYEIGVTKKYEGFVVGDRVVAIGEQQPRPPTEKTATLSSGTFEDYRNTQVTGSRILLAFGAGLLLVGVILLIVSFFLLRSLF